ncbi:hypothetical protein EJ419_05955 [Alloscardovia theropitheci]|uniref:Uncharacterized protein n=1 Tax=Alloscardovia theropitheci TaxID=2496842 RepID=A0A4R0QP26_9BIFI|nr:hypothetical protein [Alloscardovia theropitheci]TCD53972.1 hypothetical protein EJ419_05955 [Alloscardovia theropitheci]
MAAAQEREARSSRSAQSYSPMMRRSSSAMRATRPNRRTSYSTGSARPQLRVSVHDNRQRSSVMAQVRNVADNRRLSALVLSSSIALLIASLGITLVLRTQMTENAFSITQTQNSVAQLTQDVQQDRAKLNNLEAGLPERATQMGMQQGSDSMTIDMGNAQ